MIALVNLEHWSVRVAGDDAYLAPECADRVLVGTVTGHPRKADGTKVRTTAIAAVDGRIITTNSGTRYLLGEADPEYVHYLTSMGRALDPDQPIKVLP